MLALKYTSIPRCGPNYAKEKARNDIPLQQEQSWS